MIVSKLCSNARESERRAHLPSPKDLFFLLSFSSFGCSLIFASSFWLVQWLLSSKIRFVSPLCCHSIHPNHSRTCSSSSSSCCYSQRNAPIYIHVCVLLLFFIFSFTLFSLSSNQKQAKIVSVSLPFISPKLEENLPNDLQLLSSSLETHSHSPRAIRRATWNNETPSHWSIMQVIVSVREFGRLSSESLADCPHSEPIEMVCLVSN